MIKSEFDSNPNIDIELLHDTTIGVNVTSRTLNSKVLEYWGR